MHPAAPAHPGVVKFGIFELHESSGELWRNGSLVHLPPQPFQILTLLVRSRGEVVDRNRIRQEVWAGTTVDFDRSLNVAISQIRAALNDDAESPRFIQTLPRKGYRFLAEVDLGVEPPTEPLPPARRPRTTMLVAAAAVAALALAAAGFRLWHPTEAPVRVAVLPFENAGLDNSTLVESDGLFDDLLTRLGGIQPERIQVIGRRSVSYWRTPRPGGLREIGQRLNVKYAIENSIRREAGGLRVAVRLADTTNEAVLWSGTFTQNTPQQAFQESVVAGVSAAVLTTLFPGASPRSQQTACREGWEAFQTGRLLVNRGTLQDLERSLPFFQQAGCAPASAAAAEALVRLARVGSRRPQNWEQAREAARRALHSGENPAAAHLALGNIALWHDWNWQAAGREFAEALRINPSDPDAHHDLAWLQVALGSRAGALASIETAIAIDPLSARTRIDSAWLLLQTGRFQQAAAEARRTLELAPDMREARACLSRALLYAGDFRGAVDAMITELPQSAARELAALPPAEAGRRLMEIALERDSSGDPYHRAYRLAWLGSREEALTALEAAFQYRSLMMPFTAVDPAFASIRNEPRFRTIVAKLGLGN